MSKARDLANAGTALTTVSATELGYLDGVTSAVQTQINSKIGQSTAINPSTITTKGDLIVGTGNGTFVRQGVGTNGQVLTADSAQADGVTWATVTSGLTQISTGTLSGTALNLTSIPGSYNKLTLLLENFYDGADGGQDLWMRFNNDSTANAYDANRIAGGSTVYLGTGSRVVISNNNATTANRYMRFIIEVPFYASTNSKKTFTWEGAYSNSATNPGPVFGHAAWANNSAINQINLLWSGAGAFGGGTYTLYGSN